MQVSIVKGFWTLDNDLHTVYSGPSVLLKLDRMVVMTCLCHFFDAHVVCNLRSLQAAIRVTVCVIQWYSDCVGLLKWYLGLLKTLMSNIHWRHAQINYCLKENWTNKTMNFWKMILKLHYLFRREKNKIHEITNQIKWRSFMDS